MSKCEDEVIDDHSFQEYQPSQKEIVDYATYLGYQLPEDNKYLYIAEQGIKAPLPINWKACKTKNGEVYFFNIETNQSKWEHPSDHLYKQMYYSAKQKKDNSNYADLLNSNSSKHDVQLLSTQIQNNANICEEAPQRHYEITNRTALPLTDTSMQIQEKQEKIEMQANSVNIIPNTDNLSKKAIINEIGKSDSEKNQEQENTSKEVFVSNELDTKATDKVKNDYEEYNVPNEFNGEYKPIAVAHNQSTKRESEIINKLNGTSDIKSIMQISDILPNAETMYHSNISIASKNDAIGNMHRVDSGSSIILLRANEEYAKPIAVVTRIAKIPKCNEQNDLKNKRTELNFNAEAFQKDAIENSNAHNAIDSINGNQPFHTEESIVEQVASNKIKEYQSNASQIHNNKANSANSPLNSLPSGNRTTENDYENVYIPHINPNSLVELELDKENNESKEMLSNSIESNTISIKHSKSPILSIPIMKLGNSIEEGIVLENEINEEIMISQSQQLREMEKVYAKQKESELEMITKIPLEIKNDISEYKESRMKQLHIEKEKVDNEREAKIEKYKRHQESETLAILKEANKKLEQNRVEAVNYNTNLIIGNAESKEQANANNIRADIITSINSLKKQEEMAIGENINRIEKTKEANGQLHAQYQAQLNDYKSKAQNKLQIEKDKLIRSKEREKQHKTISYNKAIEDYRITQLQLLLKRKQQYQKDKEAAYQLQRNIAQQNAKENIEKATAQEYKEMQQQYEKGKTTINASAQQQAELYKQMKEAEIVQILTDYKINQKTEYHNAIRASTSQVRNSVTLPKQYAKTIFTYIAQLKATIENIHAKIQATQRKQNNVQIQCNLLAEVIKQKANPPSFEQVKLLDKKLIQISQSIHKSGMKSKNNEATPHPKTERGSDEFDEEVKYNAT